MEKKEKECLFEKYCKMIQKKAWEVSKRTGCDYSELEAHGYYLYCEAIETWNPEKSSFSTHLYYYLLQLDSHYAYDIGYQRGRAVDELSEVSERKIESKYDTTSLKEILETAEKILTIKSYNIIKWILERTWETSSVHKPSVSLVCRTFNMQRKEVEKCWVEIKDFWLNESGYLFA